MPSPVTLRTMRQSTADEHATPTDSPSPSASPSPSIQAGSRTRITRGPNTPSHGSRTMVISSTESREQTPPEGILHLRAHNNDHHSSSSGHRVQWSDDTVDNEHMGKKKSKVCCIFRKQRVFGESDSESSSGEESDGDGPNEYERMPKYKPKGKHQHGADCQH